MTGFWIALAVLLVGVVGGIAYAVLRGLSMWRHVKRTSRIFSAETARISDVSGQIQEQLDRSSASGARLVVHLAHELVSRGSGRAVAALCGGTGQGTALLLEAATAS